MTNYIIVSTIPLVISAYFLRLEVISNSIVQRMCKYSTTGDALGAEQTVATGVNQTQYITSPILAVTDVRGSVDK